MHCARFRVRKLRVTRTYDLVIRLPILAWTGTLAAALMADLEEYLKDPAVMRWDHPASGAISVAARVAVIAYLVVVAATMLVRMPPVAKARGSSPRIAGLIGTFLIVSLVAFPREQLAPEAGLISTVLILVGNAFAVLALVKLRNSFSIMAEARELVTTGVYRRIRHPLYLAEEIAAFGVLIQVLSIWTVMLVGAQIIFQLKRMHNEEELLRRVFQEYEAYRLRTARLVPGVY